MTRDDLFTHIHKGLRRGLFELTVAAGATDWTDRADVERLTGRWRALLALLRSHARHEDEHIFRLLDRHDPGVTAAVAEQHHDLDDLLDDLATRFDPVALAGDPVLGLALYRDLARFVAAYLAHLHEEETVVMERIWERCSDDEIATTRRDFTAEITPEEHTHAMELMLPSLDPTTRARLVAGVARTAPPPVLERVLAAAHRSLDTGAARALERVASAAIAGAPPDQVPITHVTGAAAGPESPDVVRTGRP